MAPRFTPSSRKHGIPPSDAAYAISHANYVVDLAINLDGTVDRLFIGPEHSQTDRELEVIVQVPIDGSGRDAVVFHVMRLGAKFTRLREERVDDA